MSMFQLSPYEGLPFVGRNRLNRFLGHWEAATPGSRAVSREHTDEVDSERTLEVRDFLHDFFQKQEDAYHLLLNYVGQLSHHMEYWLDWATPILRRPFWAHKLARRCGAAYLVMLGRKKQVAVPFRAARHLQHIHAELCRLVAFIQITAFDLLLSVEEATSDCTEIALEQALNNLQNQTSACWHIAASLDLGAVVDRGGVVPPSPSRISPPYLGTRRDLLFGSSFYPWSPLSPSGSRAERSARAEAPAAPNSTKRPPPLGEQGTDTKALLKFGREWLQQSCKAVNCLADVLETNIASSGRPSNWRRSAPIAATVGVAVASWATFALRERAAREAFVRQVRDVCQQFFHEWIIDPFCQFCYQLFRRLSADDLLNVQLRDLKAEQESLERMLISFERTMRADPAMFEMVRGHDVARAESAVASPSEMAERYFEKSMSNPISNIMQGHLLESCMVQTQRMKVLLYASLYSIDAVILQLKWDFLMAGFMPFVSLCGIGYFVALRLYQRRHHYWSRQMVRALAEVDRFLNLNSHALPARALRSSPFNLGILMRSDSREFYRDPQNLNVPPLPGGCPNGLDRRESVRTAHSWTDGNLPPSVSHRCEELKRIGGALGHLDALFRLAAHAHLEAADWRNFRRDVLDLASPELASKQKIHVVDAMRCTYNVFQVGA